MYSPSGYVLSLNLSDDEYVVTGGHYNPDFVSEYDQNGWKYDLPQMNEGRAYHGCQSFIQNNKMVSNLSCVYHSLLLQNVSTLTKVLIRI